MFTKFGRRIYLERLVDKENLTLHQRENLRRYLQKKEPLRISDKKGGELFNLENINKFTSSPVLAKKIERCMLNSRNKPAREIRPRKMNIGGKVLSTIEVILFAEGYF